MTRVCLTLISVSLAAWPHSIAAASVDYLKEIKPLLQERCYSCHGALKQKSDLRLDTVAAMLKGGKNGPALERGHPDRSLILKRVSTTDLEERMPPEHEGQPLGDEQLRLLSEWIASGAPAPLDEKGETDPKDHWAFRPCVRPPVPQVSSANPTKNPLDAFIVRRHEERGLIAQPEAPRQIQLRRLYLDLIGLPPTLEDLLAANESSADDWYERTVDRLLNDPRHGERWARHWMDIWRYSDWFGLGEELRSSQKHIWHWRDWIIESLNSDMPYDQMVRLMLAADELHPEDHDKLRATGFLARNFYLFNRNQWLEETVEHVSKGFLGLTMNCAKCHDHKYDPIRQAEFYQMRAFFEPYHVRLDVVPGEADLSKDGVPRVFDGWLDRPTFLFIRGQESQPDQSSVISPRPPIFLEPEDFKFASVSLPVQAYEPERRPGIIDTHLAAARKRLRAAEADLPQARLALIKALRQEADLHDAIGQGKTETAAGVASRSDAQVAVDDARAALHVAEAADTYAKAELASVERRAEAMQSSWAATDELTAEKRAAAVKAEREALAGKTLLKLAEAERRLVKAPGDKREALTKEIKEAREALEKAKQVSAGPVKADDKYTPLTGAKWTPTRFLNSTADDPPVTFPRLSSGRRRALAEWITTRTNPLTARVAVNHIWTRHFGVPLVPTVFDFGRKSTPSAHPELLDWLAVELMESGWSMKHVHRLIVTSAAYRRSTSLAGAEGSAAKDPDNIYLWRRHPIRLEAEVLRDSLLSLAGTLETTMGGPSVAPASQEVSRRRSVYFFHSNNERNLFLTTFDGAGVRECYRREQSVAPQQALALSNSKLTLDSAALIAARLTKEAPADDADFIHAALLSLLGIEASPAELVACKAALASWRKEESDHRAGSDDDAARTRLIWALINHNDFVTLR